MSPAGEHKPSKLRHHKATSPHCLWLRDTLSSRQLSTDSSTCSLYRCLLHPVCVCMRAHVCACVRWGLYMCWVSIPQLPGFYPKLSMKEEFSLLAGNGEVAQCVESLLDRLI